MREKTIFPITYIKHNLVSHIVQLDDCLSLCFKFIFNYRANLFCCIVDRTEEIDFVSNRLVIAAIHIRGIETRIMPGGSSTPVVFLCNPPRTNVGSLLRSLVTDF